MTKEKVTLQFETDIDTSAFLKAFAKTCGQTESELINEICHDFKSNILNYIKEKEDKRNGTNMKQ